MDFLLDRDSVRNTTITLLTGQPVYQVSTPTRLVHTETTTITKIQGYRSHNMATVEVHLDKDDICQVWGNNLTPNTSAKSFLSSNGELYVWENKREKGKVLRDKINNVLAVFEKSHGGLFNGSPKQAKLSVSPLGLPIVDEIMATFVLTEQRRRMVGDATASHGTVEEATTEVAAAATEVILQSVIGA